MSTALLRRAVLCRPEHARAGAASGYSASLSPSRPAAAEAAGDGLEAKVARWGTVKRLTAAADGSMWLCYKKGLLERYSEGGKLLWSSSSRAGGVGGGAQRQGQPAAAAGSGVFAPAGARVALRGWELAG
jgi:hypothetical protein